MNAKKKKKSKDILADSDLQTQLTQLQEAQETLQAERDELFDKLQRVSADYANYQKRVPKQVSDSIAYEKEKILKSLLPALDNFEHALLNTEGTENVEAIVAGVRIVYDQMLDILKFNGVDIIEAENQPFDPSRHEAMLRQSDPDKEDNVVLQVFQKGYKLNDRVLRPSKVIVNKTPEVKDSEPEFETENASDLPDEEV